MFSEVLYPTKASQKGSTTGKLSQMHDLRTKLKQEYAKKEILTLKRLFLTTVSAGLIMQQDNSATVMELMVNRLGA
jgi:hypothetical protein